MYGLKTLDLTEEEALVMKLRGEGKSQKVTGTMLGMTKHRVGHLLSRASRKNLAKERLKIQGDRKIRF